MAIELKRNTLTLDGFGSGMALTRDAAASGMAFLEGELEKRDNKLNEPLSSVTWDRDIPVRTGGGWVDTISYFDVNYATSGGTARGFMNNDSNELPVVQAEIGKDLARTFTWGQIIKVPLIDQEKLSKIGRSLDDILNKGLRLSHDKMLDENVYTGFDEYGSHGIINNPNITTVTAAAGAAGKTTWADKTPDEILDDINTALAATYVASEYDDNGMANHILLPFEEYTHLATRKLDDGSGMSILKYLKENNIASQQGIDLTIFPCKWCKSAGTGKTDRMALYRNDEDMLRFDITVPLKRTMSQISPEHLSYLTPYVTQFSEVYWPYMTHAMYVDGI